MVDLGISLFTSAGILLLLALEITVLRCYSRIYIVKAFGLDDWLMLVTVVRNLILISLFSIELYLLSTLDSLFTLLRVGFLREIS